MSGSVRPQRRQPTRLPRPWDSPGRNTGVGCHFLLQCVKVKVKSLSRVRLLATPRTAAHQVPPSMGFSRQENWSGVPLPSPITTNLERCIQRMVSSPTKQIGKTLKPQKPHHSVLALVAEAIRRRQWQPTPVLLPRKSHGRRSLVGCSPWGCEESDSTERLHFHFSLSCIGEGNGNPLQCSCLENPRDRQPGGLPSMGSHRVGHY